LPSTLRDGIFFFGQELPDGVAGDFPLAGIPPELDECVSWSGMRSSLKTGVFGHAANLDPGLKEEVVDGEIPKIYP